MNKLIILPISILLFISCKRDWHKDLIVNDSKGIIRKGRVINDSLFDGVVKLYDYYNRYIGFETYSFGIKNGASVRYFPNEKKSDSLFYSNGQSIGYVYEYDSTGLLIDKSFNYNGRSVGPHYIYNRSANCIKYYFYSFEGALIYSSKTEKDTSNYELGSEINLRVTSIKIDNDFKSWLFLYLVLPHYLKVHYALAILDSNNKILSTEMIIADNTFFYEKILDQLSDKKSYAIIRYIYNPYKGREDLKIAKLCDGVEYGFQKTQIEQNVNQVTKIYNR